MSTLGCSPSESESSNRVTIFTNAMVCFGIIMGAALSVQLPAFGVPIKYVSGIILFTLTGGVVLALNYRGQRFAARIATVVFGCLIGWNAMIIFGKTFNGYYVFFVGMIYSVLAFSEEKLSTRITMVVLMAANMPASDWFFHERYPTISGLDSRDFPFAMLWIDTVLYSAFIVIMVWIEKAKADLYEKGLNEALLTVEREKQRIQVIFDNVSQGILTVNSDMQVEPHFSSFLKEIFPEEKLAGEKLVDVLFKKSSLSEDLIKTIESSIDFCLGEDELNWDINSGHLPREVKVDVDDQMKTLDLSWSPIVENDTVTQVILSIADVTEKVHFKLKEEESKKRASFTQAVFEVFAKSGVTQLVLFNKSLVNIISMINSGAWQTESQEFERELHGLKGEARLLGLSKLAEEIHQLESLLAESQPNNLKINQYSQLFELFLKSSEAVVVPLSGESDHSWSLLGFVGELKRRAIDQLATTEAKLTLHKIRCEDGVTNWPVQYVKPLQNILLHSVQNSIDHGYLLRDLDRPIELNVFAFESIKGFEVIVEDFGAGLNMKKITHKFNELPESQRKSLNQPTDVLFLDNMSTADQVSITSGRGVGLSAVKAEVEELHGTIELDNCETHSGTILKISLPKIFVQTKAA